MFPLIYRADMCNSSSWTVTLARLYPLSVRPFSATSTGFLLQYGSQEFYSRIFTDLFSKSATNNSKATYLSNIDELERLLEQQRQAIPRQFQLGTKLRPQAFSYPCGILAALRVHYHYHDIKIALRRMKLHITRDQSTSQSQSTILR